MSLAVHAAPPARRQELLEDLDAAFARFLRLDVANGDAALDTVRGYRSQLAAWVAWCAEHAVDARTATTDDIKRYREDLVAQGRRPTTIAHFWTPRVSGPDRSCAACSSAARCAPKPRS